MMRLKIAYKKILRIKLIVFVISTTVIIFILNENISYCGDSVTLERHHLKVADFYSKRKSWNTSRLGAMLFKNIGVDVSHGTALNNSTYTVLIWKYWSWLKRRHLTTFDRSRTDPLEECSVKNCQFTGDDGMLDTADAVVVHLQHGDIPKTKNRKSFQKWVFLSDESPMNTFSLAKKKMVLSDLSNVFNWSMTFRSESDIPVPYGRTVPLLQPLVNDITSASLEQLVPNWKRKKLTVPASILMSNCNAMYRLKYLKELMKYMQVDVYGKCSETNKNRCPGHFQSDCDAISEYVFYLAFENALCEQYLTEKLFYNAYNKGAIPVILGPPSGDCEKLLPPNSYLHIDNYGSVQDLATDIENIIQDGERLLSFHEWRNDFAVTNEHGYFRTKSQHLCRICEALNYNDDKEKIYTENDLRLFLEPKVSCKMA